MADTAARVDMLIYDNATWEDAFQFGTPGDTSWSFTGMSFQMDIKRRRDDASPVISLTSGAGQMVVADAVNRILYMNVPPATIDSNLNPAEYQYDLLMSDTSVPPVVVMLMRGELKVKHGITGEE